MRRADEWALLVSPGYRGISGQESINQRQRPAHHCCEDWESRPESNRQPRNYENPRAIGPACRTSTWRGIFRALPLSYDPPGCSVRIWTYAQSGGRDSNPLSGVHSPLCRPLALPPMVTARAVNSAPPERLELPTPWFVARCSGPLSYGGVLHGRRGRDDDSGRVRMVGVAFQSTRAPCRVGQRRTTAVRYCISSRTITCQTAIDATLSRAKTTTPHLARGAGGACDTTP